MHFFLISLWLAGKTHNLSALCFMDWFVFFSCRLDRYCEFYGEVVPSLSVDVVFFSNNMNNLFFFFFNKIFFFFYSFFFFAMFCICIHDLHNHNMFWQRVILSQQTFSELIIFTSSHKWAGIWRTKLAQSPITKAYHICQVLFYWFKHKWSFFFFFCRLHKAFWSRC